jgi:hypothetical protein
MKVCLRVGKSFNSPDLNGRPIGYGPEFRLRIVGVTSGGLVMIQNRVNGKMRTVAINELHAGICRRGEGR